MYSELNPNEIVFVIGCLVGVLALFAWALFARQIEIECGLKAAHRRLYSCAAIAGTLTVLVLAVFWLLVFGGPSASQTSLDNSPSDAARKSKADENPEIKKLRTDLADVKRELDELASAREKLGQRRTELQSELRKLQKERDLDDTGEPVESPPAARTFNLGYLVLILAPVGLCLSAILLFVLGDPRTLLVLFGNRALRTEHRLKETVKFERMVELSQKGSYAAALDLARQIDERALDHLDALDFLYFKSFSAVYLGTTRPTTENPLPLDLPPRELLDQAKIDLESLLAEAPCSSEAAYLLGYLYAFLGDHARGLELFDQSLVDLESASLPLARNRSVCLLCVAEQLLGRGDMEGANQRFGTVAELKVMAEQVPTSWVKVRFQNVRQSLKSNNFTQATDELAAIRKIERLDEQQRGHVELTCAAFESLIPVRQSNDEEAVRRIDAFLRRFLPAELLHGSEELIDEHLESACDRLELPLGKAAYRELLITLSASRARIFGRAGRPLDESQVQELIEPLLCALQFHLRHRDVLAALGVLFYWFRKEQRAQALEWIQSAVTMGVQSRVVARLLERDRLREAQQRQTLDWFRSKSARFLRDPTLKRQVRQALIEELGRFQEYHPLLLDLENVSATDEIEPSVPQLQERAKYIGDLASHLATQKRKVDVGRMENMRREYAQVVQVLNDTAAKLWTLEQGLFTEVAKAVLS